MDQISAAAVVTPGQPQDRLEVEEPGNTDEDNIEYPTGLKLWVSISSLLTSMIFVGLDMTIVAVAVPSLTDHFRSIDDIGWYSSAYMLFFCSFVFLHSQLYSVFSVKKLYLIAICIFQLGSLLCTIAPKSKVFILGRAVAGLGAGGLGIGGQIITSYSFPKQKKTVVDWCAWSYQLNRYGLCPCHWRGAHRRFLLEGMLWNQPPVRCSYPNSDGIQLQESCA